MIVPIHQFGFELCEDLSTPESFEPISKSKNATIKPNIGPNDPREQGESTHFEIWFEAVANFEIEKITKPLQIHGICDAANWQEIEEVMLALGRNLVLCFAVFRCLRSLQDTKPA